MIIFVVNGKDVPVEIVPGMTLREARARALRQSQNIAWPAEDWEISQNGPISELALNGLTFSPEAFDPLTEIRFFLTFRADASGVWLS